MKLLFLCSADAGADGGFHVLRYTGYRVSHKSVFATLKPYWIWPTQNLRKFCVLVLIFCNKMGGSQSTEVPGGGTEGYHVLRVRNVKCLLRN